MFGKMQFLTQNLTNPLNRLKKGIKDLKDLSLNLLENQKINLIEIVHNQIYHIDPLNQKNINHLFQILKSANQYQIWNISEYPYPENILTKILGPGGRNSDGRQVVFNLTYQFFANIPFCQMIKAIQNIESFLQLDSNNKVFIHCQQNKRRSAVFLSSYIFLTGIHPDIVQAILEVNRKLNLSIEDKSIDNQKNQITCNSIYKSQHLVLKNLMNYINNNAFINKKAWILNKILINHAPNINQVLKNNLNKVETGSKSHKLSYKVLFQIRSVQGLICKKIFNDEFLQGESICLRIQKDQIIHLKDDFLIIIKYVYEKKGYSILRTQLNTNFIYDNYLRVQRQDMDLSVKNAHFKNQNIFMDLTLQADEKIVSQLSKLSIIKEIVPEQTKGIIQEKQNLKQMKVISQQENKEKIDEQDDDFKILDEEQQAEKNQKMQKEIQEQFQRELQNLRKKRTLSKQDQLKANQKQSDQDKVESEKIQEKTSKFYLSQDVEQQETIQIDEKRQLVLEKNDGVKQSQDVQIEKQSQNEQIINQKQQKQSLSEDQSSQSNEGQEQKDQQDQQDQDQEEKQQDLDAYLQKLQKQATKQ